MPVTDIQLKTLTPQRVVGLHESVGPDSSADVEALFERVIASMDALSGSRAVFGWHAVRGLALLHSQQIRGGSY